jgi:hypothetical protein
LSGNDKEFLGLTHNRCLHEGIVIGDPIIHGDSYAFFRVRTAITEQDANGQWTDVPIDVPIVTTNPKVVAVLEQYVKDGRRLSADTYYKAWIGNDGTPQHAFVIKSGGLKLGPPKYIPREDRGMPGMPTG